MTRRILAIVAAALVVWMSASQKAAGQEPIDPSRARGTLEVQVVDESGKSLRGVTVAVPGFRSTTGSAGTCRFSLVPGRYSAGG